MNPRFPPWATGESVDDGIPFCCGNPDCRSFPDAQHKPGRSRVQDPADPAKPAGCCPGLGKKSLHAIRGPLRHDSTRCITVVMAFSEELIRAAWKRLEGRCECTLADKHGHGERCGRPLLWALRGATGEEGWDPVRRMSWATDVLANCEIRCAKCQGPKIVPVQ